MAANSEKLLPKVLEADKPGFGTVCEKCKVHLDKCRFSFADIMRHKEWCEAWTKWREEQNNDNKKVSVSYSNSYLFVIQKRAQYNFLAEALLRFNILGISSFAEMKI